MGRFVYAEGEYYHDMAHGSHGPCQGSATATLDRISSFPA